MPNGSYRFQITDPCMSAGGLAKNLPAWSLGGGFPQWLVHIAPLWLEKLKAGFVLKWIQVNPIQI